MARRPIIGVTGPANRLPWAWWATRWHLKRLGADPRRLTPDAERHFEEFDGFVIGGGNDIDPAVYGGDVSESPTIDPERDQFELRVLDFADTALRPVMGICRGAQLINVHAGGTLISDLKPLRRLTSNRGTLLPRKKVRVDEESMLADFLGTTSTKVNSLHHQAVETCGVGLVETAWDRDNIVQAIESRTSPLRIGVQWHPEYMPQRRSQRNLFERFVAVCVEEHSGTGDDETSG